MGKLCTMGACLGILFAWMLMPAGIAMGQGAGDGYSPFVPEEVAPTPDTGLDLGEGVKDLASSDEPGYSDAGSYGGCGTSYAGCCLCGPPGKVWFRSDYLVWWGKGTRIPALVTTTSRPAVQLPPGTQADAEAFAASGTLGDPFTTVLFGNDKVNEGARQGYRMTLGYWFGDGCQVRGIQADYFDMGGRSTNYDSSAGGNDPAISMRPFTDLTPPGTAPVPSRELVSYPNLLQGRATVSVRDSFESAGVALRLNMVCCSPCGTATCCDAYMAAADSRANDCFRLDMLAGYRYYQLGDTVAIREQLVTTGGITPLGTTFDVQDVFRAENDFHSAELGMIMQWYRGRWSFDFLAKMALGNNHQSVFIDGRTEIAVPGLAPVVYDSGFLALEGTNVGQYDRDSFVVIPQFGIEVGYQLTCRLRAFMGYNFLYWAQVTRAGDTIDLAVNQEYVPPPLANPTGPRRPAYNNGDFPWAQTDYWAQGLNLGLELRY